MRLLIASMAMVAALCACGGGSGAPGSAQSNAQSSSESSSSSSSSTSAVNNADPGGIWTGVESVSGLGVTGIVDEVGDAVFIRSDGVLYTGSITPEGDNISATVQGFTDYPARWPDNSTHGAGTVVGTIVQRVSARLTTSFTTDAGTITNGTLNLSYDSRYQEEGTIAALVGTYNDALGQGVTVTVHADGTFNGQSADSGCVVNGIVQPGYQNFNAYRVQATFADCGAGFNVLNGSYSGLAMLDTNQNPAELLVGIASAQYGQSFVLYAN